MRWVRLARDVGAGCAVSLFDLGLMGECGRGEGGWWERGRWDGRGFGKGGTDEEGGGGCGGRGRGKGDSPGVEEVSAVLLSR